MFLTFCFLRVPCRLHYDYITLSYISLQMQRYNICFPSRIDHSEILHFIKMGISYLNFWITCFMTIQPISVNDIYCGKTIDCLYDIWIDTISWSDLLMFGSPADLCCLLNLPPPSGIINDLWNLLLIAQNPLHGRQCRWAFYEISQDFEHNGFLSQLRANIWRALDPWNLFSTIHCPIT